VDALIYDKDKNVKREELLNLWLRYNC